MKIKHKSVQSNGIKERIVARKYKQVMCYNCNRFVEIDENCIGGTCWKCTAKMAGFPEIKSESEKSKFPPGWRFMAEFVDYEYNVYRYGELCEELKGTLEPTDVDKIKADIKLKKEQNKKRRLQREEKLKEKENKLREKAKLQEKKAKDKLNKVKRKK